MTNKFEQSMNILNSLRNYLEELQSILEIAKKDPEIFLKEPFLQYNTDRNYIWTNIIACCGEEGLEQFLLEYYDCVIEALKCKIPISDVQLRPFVLNGESVLLGIIYEKPVLAINTFSKTIQLLPDEQRMELEKAIAKSESFIEQLAEQLEELNSQKGGLLKTVNKKAYEQKLKAQKTILMSQISTEQQTLRDLKENLGNYDYRTGEILQIRDRYCSRLKTYYGFVCE